jgi:hypothetical protein
MAFANSDGLSPVALIDWLRMVLDFLYFMREARGRVFLGLVSSLESGLFMPPPARWPRVPPPYHQHVGRSVLGSHAFRAGPHSIGSPIAWPIQSPPFEWGVFLPLIIFGSSPKSDHEK